MPDPQTGGALLLAASRKIAARRETSASRARQVRWVAGEYGRALDHVEHPLGQDATAGDLFERPAVDAYLELASRGELRTRAAAAPARYSEASEMVRIQVLHQLAQAAGASSAGLPPVLKAQARTPVASRPRSLLRTSLTTLADRPGATPGQLRMLAIGTVVVDTAARAGELCSREVEDLSPTMEELRLLRRPQGWSEADAYLELVALSALTRAALRRWLPERQALLQRVTGTATKLWVTLHVNHISGQVVPEGTPLQPRGLARAWTKTVATTNVELGGEPDWEPLPTRMEQLRRGVTPTAVAAPRDPDAERASALLEAVAARGAQLAAARAEEEGSTAELEARVAVRAAVRDAWAEGIEHQVQLAVLAEAGLGDAGGLAAAGWEPTLLAAVDRAGGVGRPSRSASTAGERS